MGALGGIIDSAVDAGLGRQSGTTLQDFLNNFSSSEGVWVKTIDPLQTFDVRIKFYPTKDAVEKKKDWLDRVGDSLMSSAKSAVKNLANNVTGGLLGSIMNSDVSIITQRDKFGNIGKQTFMEYLAAANLLVGKEDWIGESAGESISPLELQLGIYCQEITLPNIEVPESGRSTNAFGEFPINGTFVKTDSNVVTMKIVNTKVPLHERIFYPWLRETTLPWWSYKTQPYTTATIIVDFTKHADIKYVFYGCRPQKIIMAQATQDSSASLSRDVSFIFDFMTVQSDLKNCESLAEKLLSTGKSLFNSAAGMVNI